uniref:glycosyltransferase family 2 protein n=1 Tax=Succinivibrio sp. TaxID=2053619 RepID=UPI00402A5F18
MLDSGILFSIYTPVYNSEKFIRYCLDSVLSQTVSNFEWYIHDDGSTDSSYKICEEYAKKDKRIHLVKNKNGTSIQDMNTFLSIAKGEFIAFVDHDDYLDSNFLEKCYSFLIKSGADCAITSYTLVDADNKNLDWYVPNLENGKILSKEELKKRFLTSLDIEGFRWNKIYRSSVYKKANLKFLDRFPADILFEFSIFDHISSAVLVDSHGYYYRQSSTSEVGMINIKKCLGMLSSFEAVSMLAKKNNLKEEAELYKSWRYVNLMFSYIYGNKIDKESIKKIFSTFPWKRMVSKNVISTLFFFRKYNNKKDCYFKFLLKTIYVWIFSLIENKAK